MLWNEPGRDINQAAVTFEESLALFRELNDPYGLNDVLTGRAAVAIAQEDFEYARSLLNEALTRARAADDTLCTAHALTRLGRLAWFQNHDVKQATTFCQESLSLYRETRELWGVAHTLTFLAGIKQAVKLYGRSQAHYQDALILLRKKGLYKHTVVAHILAGLGSLAAVDGQLERAARVFGAAETGVKMTTLLRYATPATFDSDVASLRAQLGDVAFAKAWAEGKGMTRDQAIAYALQPSDI